MNKYKSITQMGPPPRRNKTKLQTIVDRNPSSTIPMQQMYTFSKSLTVNDVVSIVQKSKLAMNNNYFLLYKDLPAIFVAAIVGQMQRDENQVEDFVDSINRYRKLLKTVTDIEKVKENYKKADSERYKKFWKSVYKNFEEYHDFHHKIFHKPDKTAQEGFLYPKLSSFIN